MKMKATVLAWCGALCIVCTFSNSALAGHWYVAGQAGAVFLMDSEANAEMGGLPCRRAH
jgi:hypothetical protein